MCIHGEKVVRDKTVTGIGKAPPRVKELLARARELTLQGKFWHHHLLFPDCFFNKNKGKWTIVFEDKEKGEILESVSTREPREDLKWVETLFYQQSEKG